MKTLIAIPCMDMMHTDFVKSLLYLEKGEGVNVCFKESSLIYDSRNLLSITAIQEDFDYVLWLDSDMVFLPDTLKRLRASLEIDPSISMVSGLYVKRRHPIEPVIYKTIEPPTVEHGVPTKHIVTYADHPHDQPFPIAGCGFGCTMTRVSLLKQVWDRFGPAFTPFPWAGEDISFCYRVNQIAPNLIWCDSSVQCGHVGTRIFTEDDLKRGESIESDLR